jgi:hypothetical protein
VAIRVSGGGRQDSHLIYMSSIFYSLINEMDWIAGNSLYKSSPYTRQQQQSTMHAINIYNTQYRISYSKGNNSSIQ